MSPEVSQARVLAALDKILRACSEIQIELARANLIAPAGETQAIGRMALRSSAPPPSKSPPSKPPLRRFAVRWMDPQKFTYRTLLFVAASADDARLMAAPSLGLNAWHLDVEEIEELDPEKR